MMYFLLGYLVAILCCSSSNAATSTKINYLPNGQVAGYQLIINNTVEPSAKTPLPRDRVSKIFKHTSRSGDTFTTVDEQVNGENSYLNVHRVLKQYQARMKYPLKNVLMIPSVRYNNRVAENVKLRFAQIGPYAALIVPLNETNHFANVVHSLPPEVRNSVKNYIEVQEPSPQSSQKTDYVYDPPTYPKTPHSGYPLTTDGNPQPSKYGKDTYRYPAAIPIEHTFKSQENGNPEGDRHPGFVIRVVNPTTDKGQEFFVPADPSQLVPEKNDKIIANPFKHFGLSDSPSPSQFKEIYTKDDSSPYKPSEFEAPNLPTAFKPSAGSSEPSRGESQIKTLTGPDTKTSPHFQSSWSLVETKDPFGNDPLLSRPPPDQPEFSDVAPAYPSGQSSDYHTDSNHPKNQLFSSQQSDRQSGAVIESAGSSATIGQTVQGNLDFIEGKSTYEVSNESGSEGNERKDQKFEQIISSEELKLESASDGDSTANSREFQKANLSPQSSKSPSTDFHSELKEERGKFGDEKTNGESNTGTVESERPFSDNQVTTESNLGQFSDGDVIDSGVLNSANQAESLQESNVVDRNKSHTTDSTQQFIQGNSEHSKDQSPSDEFHQQFGKLKSEFEQESKDESAVSSGDGSLTTSSIQSDQQFGRLQSGSDQKQAQITNLDSASAVNQQSNLFQGTNFQNINNGESGVQIDKYQSVLQLNEANAGAASVGNKQSGSLQEVLTQNIGEISYDSKIVNSANKFAQLNQYNPAPTSYPLPTPQRVSSSQGALVQVDPERIRNLIKDSHFKFLSPDGQTTAVLTSSGNSAIVEYPSQASPSGRENGKIVIPKITIPVPSSSKFDDVVRLVNPGSSDLLRQQYNAGSFASAGATRLEDVFSHIGEGYTPISNFDATAAAAAAAAAVAAGNDHVKHTESSEAITLQQLPQLNSEGLGNEQRHEQKASDNQSFKHPETVGLTAFNGRENENQKHLASTSPKDTSFDNVFSSMPVEHRPFSHVDAGAAVAVNDNFKHFGSSGNIAVQQVPLLSLVDSRNGQRNEQDSSKESSSKYSEAAGLTAVNDGDNENQEHTFDWETGAKAETSLQNSQLLVDGVKTEDLSHFFKETSALNHVGINTEQLIGNSQLNFLAGPGNGQNAALLSTSNNQFVKAGIAKEPGNIQHGEVVIPKYPISIPNQARIPINLGTGGSVIADLQEGNRAIGKFENFSRVAGFESSSVGGAAGVNGNQQRLISSSAGGFQAQGQIPLTALPAKNLKSEGASLNAGSLSTSSTHFLTAGVPQVSGTSHEVNALPKYLTDLPNGAIPIIQSARPRQFISGRHFTEGPRPYPLSPAVIHSHSASPIGPHTEQLLETLNGIVALPRRHSEPSP